MPWTQAAAHDSSAPAGQQRAAGYKKALLQSAPSKDVIRTATVWQRAAAGDAQAFTELWHAHHAPLLRYLQIRCGTERGEDLAADVWAKVLTNAGGFTGRTHGQFRAWLLTVGRNTLIDATRRRDWHTTVTDVIAEQPAGDLTVEQVLQDDATRRAVRQIAQLPDDQAEVVALRIVADLDTRAVAQITGRSTGSVRVLLHRGLSTLRQICEVADEAL